MTIPNQKQVKMTKKQKILNHLMSGQSLTQWECTHLYRHLRLGAVVHELRNQGYNIITHLEKNASDDGKHARYVLVKGVAQ